MSNCDVIVVGGGVIGCSCAYALARAGLAVELLEERHIAAEASWASAGMIDGHSLGRAADGEYVRLKASSAAMFAAMAAQLQSETGIDCEYHVTGKLELALNERQQKHLQRLADGAAAVWQDGDAIRRREPRLHPHRPTQPHPWPIRPLSRSARFFHAFPHEFDAAEFACRRFRHCLHRQKACRTRKRLPVRIRTQN